MKEQTISNLKKLKSFHNGSFGADIDRAIQALEQQPCEDCVSREALDNAISDLTYWHFENDRLVTGGGGSKTETVYKVDDVWRLTHVLPSVTPKYTDEEIQKMQELEQVQLEKAYELRMQTSFEEWLSSFNTESATCCFTAVQELKKKLEDKK